LIESPVPVWARVAEEMLSRRRRVTKARIGIAFI
jgi:hypothetical protein